jgi:hypothetical protein
MADYYPLIARAVAGLEKNTGEGRRVLYERARTALVTQLRGVVPALSESDITRERLALEESIRKVEAEAARQSREAPRPEPGRRDSGRREETVRPLPSKRDFNQPPAPAPNRAPPDIPRAAAQPDAAPARRPPRTPPGERYPDEGMKGFRDVVAEAENLGEATAQASRSARQAYAATPPGGPEHARLEPRLDPEGLRPPPRKPQPGYEPMPGTALEPTFGGSLEPTMMLEDARSGPSRQRAQRTAAIEDDLEAAPHPAPAAGGGFLRVLIAIVLVLLVCATAFWQRQTIVAAVQGMMSLTRTTTPPASASRDVALSRTKIPDRISPSGQNGLPDMVAQRVVLYEEDPSDAAGKQFVGTAVWKTETVSPGPGLPPDVVIRANIEIPDRQMKVSWSLRRNSDKTLPASHTVDIMFTLPADFPHGGISTIPGLLMKQAEQTRGVPLAGQSVKVTTGYFLIGLSSVESDLQRNVQLLKERAWFDIPIVYGDNRRAILAVEKGSPGETAFADAFTAWAR